MREIKFRAWDAHDKKMYPACRFVDGYFQLQDGRNLGNFMQFTGLHDKNGKEIYEGDIVNMFQSGAVVSRNNVVELADFLGGHYWVTHHGKIPAYEIIGNIHENPELLEELA